MTPVLENYVHCDDVMRIGALVECKKDGLVVGTTNSFDVKIPVGCRFDDASPL